MEKFVATSTAGTISTESCPSEAQWTSHSHIQCRCAYFLATVCKCSAEQRDPAGEDWELCRATIYDLHCPSVEPHLSKRCCSVCGLYHASVKSALSNSRGVKGLSSHNSSVYCDSSPTGEEATCKNSCQTSTGDDGRPSRPLEWRNSRMG